MNALASGLVSETMSAEGAQLPYVTRAVAAFIAEVDMSGVPAAVFEKARQVIADSLGCMLAGAGSELRDAMLSYLDDGAVGVVPVIGTGRSASPQAAALVNGAFGAALDYDDLIGSLHPSSVIVSALISANGAAPVSGRHFIESYIIGLEIGAKMAVALGPDHPRRGFHATSTLSGFAAFAAVARLKRLPVDQVATGLSLVASQSGGVLCQLGTMTKPLHSGLAARVAIDAERLAAHGVTASQQALEGRRGYFEAYGGESSDVARMPGLLGQPWSVIDPGSTLKRFASSVAGHRGMAAVLELKAQGLTAANLVKLDCAVAPGALRPMMYPRPSNGFESKFSMPYALAAAVLDDKLCIASFETPATQRPEIDELLARIHAWEDPMQAIEDPVSANRSWGYRGYVRATATLADGRVLVARVDVHPGAPSKPLSWDDLHAKFLDCAQCCDLSADRAGAAFERLRDLESCPDIRTVLAALQP